LFVSDLQLINFRGYRQVGLRAGTGNLLFLGDNAQGKSNLLEAVYLLATGRSIRAGSDAEMIGWGGESTEQPFTRVQAAVERSAGSIQLEALVAGLPPATDAGAARAGKRYRVNGVPRRGIDFVGQLRAVIFTAGDLDIISGPPAARRSFLDAALSQLDRAYYGCLQRYNRIMQQRNASLRRIREGLAGPDELSLWDEGFVREGAAIVAARQDATQRLARLAAEAHASLSGEVPEALDLSYLPELGEEWRALVPPHATATSLQPLFATALASQRRRETAAGVSLVGPHRDDVAMNLNGVSAASYGSRAQVRTAALALRLAEAHLLRSRENDPPVLLLDDIVSELDETRRASVLAGVSGFDQVWFTASGGASLPSEFLAGCTTYRVASGEITPIASQP
jgi:DNA replication and repair protein RecF